MTPGKKGLVGLVLAAALVAPAAAHADTAGLVAAYGFEEASGTTATDSSTAGNTGTLAGGLVRSTSGKFGRALSFDGIDDRVNVNDANSLDLATGMTLEAWVNPSAANANWRTVLLKEQPAALAYALYSDEGAARPSVHAFTSREFDTRGTAAAPLNAWTHLTGTYDGATLRLYVNGAQVSSKAVTGALKSTAGALRIGGNAIWGEYFKGLIDEVRVYNRALTAAEIAADMAAPVVPADPAPSAPGSLTASVAGDDVTLSWTAATDNAGVTGYRVHRASTSGFTPSDANLIATTTGTSRLDADVPAGTYYYKVVAVDTAGQTGNPSNEASGTVLPLPDTTPPTVALTGECPFTVSRIAHIFGTRADDSGNAPSVELRLDGARIVAQFSSGAGSGQFDREWDTFYTPNGTYTLTVVARDAAGNEATSAPCEVTVDNVPQAIAFTSVTDGETVSGTVPVTAAQTSGAGCGCWIRIKIDGSTVGLYASPPATFSWNTTGLANGSVHTLTAELLSNYLDEPPYTTTSIQVTTDQRDVTPPAPPVLWAGADSTGDVHLSIDADPGVSVYRYHRSLTPDFTPTDANLIKTTASRTTTDGSRPTGTWYYRAVAVDAAGNRSATSNEATAVVAPDLEAPMPVYIEDASCGNGAAIAGTVTIKSRAGDNRWVKTLQLKLDGDDLGAPFVGTPGAVAATLTTSWDTRLTTNGLHVLTAVARDLDGNETTSPPCTYTVDNSAPPTVSVTAPTDGATVSGAVSVRANADDDRAVRDVQFRLDGNALGAADTTMPYSISWDTTTAPNGSHTVTAVARDYDGNTTTSSAVNVTVNNAASGLVGAYGFEETSGTTAADGSGKGNAGTVSGATQSASGRFGRALSFDGVNDFVSVADASSLDLTTALTLEGWVKPATISGSWRTVLLKERPGGLAYALYAAADNGRPSANLWAGSGETEVRGTSATSTTAWTHLATTYDSVALRLYVNGTQVATTPLTAPVTVSTGALKIGGNAIWPEWFKGLIDEVRVYNRVLGPGEIAADRDTPVVP